jgi:hypothetical protein
MACGGLPSLRLPHLRPYRLPHELAHAFDSQISALMRLLGLTITAIPQAKLLWNTASSPIT